MPTATISDTTWAGVSPAAGAARLSVRTLRLPRIRGAFLTVEVVTLAAALFYSLYTGAGAGAFVLLACCAFFFHVNGLDRTIASSETEEWAVDVAVSLALGSLVASVLFVSFPFLHPTTTMVVIGALISFLLPAALRPLLHFLVVRQKLVEGVVVAGTGDLARKLHSSLAESRKWADGCSEHNAYLSNTADRRVAIEFAELEEFVAQSRVSRVIVAEQHAANRAALAEALLAPRLRGLKVTDAVDFYEENTGKLWLEAINREWFVYTNGFAHSPTSLRLERIFDVLFALVLIVLTSPLLILIAIAIKLDSRGPVLFQQVRVGLQGKPFTIYKFRSMRVDAEISTGPVWSSERDDRVTAVGRLLRRYRLDELLQAFNVLRGDMSLVGPRPERPCFVERLEQQIRFYDLRHFVKPGITGWAQVMYSYGDSIEDAYQKLQYDLYYTKHKSFGCNVWILLMTVKIVLFGRGR